MTAINLFNQITGECVENVHVAFLPRIGEHVTYEPWERNGYDLRVIYVDHPVSPPNTSARPPKVVVFPDKD